MKKRRMRRIPVLLILALVTGAACYTVFWRQDGPKGQYVYTEEKAEYGDLMQGITESGLVELLTTDQVYDLELDLDDDDKDDDDSEDEAETQYLRIEKVYVTPGQRIRDGEAVFKLTDRSVAAVRRKLETAKSEAQVVLAEAQSTYTEENLSAGHTYQESTLAGKLAQDEYRIASATLKGQILEAYAGIEVLEKEIKQIEDELKESWEDYDDLRTRYVEAEKELERCDESRLTRYIDLRDDYRQIKAQYDREVQWRQEQQENIRKKQEEILKLQMEIQRLSQKLERQELDAQQTYQSSAQQGQLAREIYNYSMEGLKEDVDNARTDLEEAAKALEAFEAFVGDGTVYAEGSGLVTAVNYKAGDYLKREGAMLSYVREDDYVLSIDISGEDIPYVEVGKKVTIVFTAYPDDIYQGEIREISAPASQNHATTISYPVTVKILGDTAALFGGMTGDVTFVTGQARQVVYVSRKAIVEQNGKTFVYQQGALGEMGLTPVETGFTDGISVEIRSGLKKGDTVYVATRISGNQSEQELQGQQAPRNEGGN